MFKERPLDTLSRGNGICSRCSCYWIFGNTLQAQYDYLKSVREAKTELSRFFSTVFWSFETKKLWHCDTVAPNFVKMLNFLAPFIKKISLTLLVDFARVLCGCSCCGPRGLLQLIRITRLRLFSKHVIGSAQCYSYCHWPIVLSVKTLTKDCNRRYIHHVSYFYDRKVISL